MTKERQLALAPFLFVALWSTSWIVVRSVAPYADPLTFLALRFEFAALVGALIAHAAKAPQPANLKELGHMLLSGLLMHAFYVGGMWWGVAHGLPLAISAIIAAAQPLLSAILAPLARERLTERQWLGVMTGFAGVAIVIAPNLFHSNDMGGLLPILTTVCAIVSVTLGTYHQKLYLPKSDLRTLSAYQYIGALVVMFPAAWLLEPMYFELQVITTLALLWSVLGLSITAMLLYVFMTRQHTVTRVASLIYLIPPIVALEAYLFFGESLGLFQLVGIVLAAAGVYLSTHSPRPGLALESED